MSKGLGVARGCASSVLALGMSSWLVVEEEVLVLVAMDTGAEGEWLPGELALLTYGFAANSTPTGDGQSPAKCQRKDHLLLELQ